MNAVSSVSTPTEAYSKELPSAPPVAAHADPVTITDAAKLAFKNADNHDKGNSSHSQ
jgi:hypothetical protein